MIREIHLRNFKCFRELNLALSPLTLLAGLNGMGKSSVVQAILLLHQSFESGDLAAGRLLLGGDFADLGSGVDVLYEDAEQDVIEIGLEVERVASAPYDYNFYFRYDREGDRLQDLEVARKIADEGFYDPATPFLGGISYLS